jgi:hypothetical protein
MMDIERGAHIVEPLSIFYVTHCSYILTINTLTFTCSLFVCFRGRPWQATDVLQPAGLLYRPLWTFQLWPPDAPAPTDAFLTLAA